MSTSERRQRLRDWIRSNGIVTQAAWSRFANISRPTAIKDFKDLEASGVRLEPWYQGSKVMGYIAREVA